MKIAYVSVYDASDLGYYSGTAYYLGKALENAGIEVLYIGNLKFHNKLYHKIKAKIYKILFNKIYIHDRHPRVLKYFATQIEERLRNVEVDLLFSFSSVPLTYVNISKPKVIFPDATFIGMIDFYKAFTNLCKETIRDGKAQEQHFFDKAACIIFSSQWAADAAAQHHGVHKNKIRIVPYGANIEPERNIEDIKEFIENKDTQNCNLLFLGVDWHRKGGNTALQVTKQLNENGISATLSIVGCTPPENTDLPAYINNIGYIDKSTEEGRRRINRLIEESHFLVLPTEADCTPIVFAEANSYGVPCVTKSVGGVSSMISNGVNGIAVDKNANISEYTDFISEYFSNSVKYKELAYSSFNEYKTRLNWSVAGLKLKEIFSDIIQK
jgi:glycosyltransferase involved in cell wall biosynthesis